MFNFSSSTRKLSKGGKALNILLSVILVIGLMPSLSAFAPGVAYAAEGTDNTVSPNTVSAINGTVEGSSDSILSSAASAATDTKNITSSIQASTTPSEGNIAGTMTVASAGTVGEAVSVQAAPSTGYYLASITYSYTEEVGGVSKAVTKYIDIANNGKYDGKGGTYSFTMPDADVDVVASFITTVWDGSLDFTWYDESSYVANAKGSYYMYYPAQWEALAWICSEDLAFLVEASVDRSAQAAQDETKTVQQYMDSKGWTKAYQYNTNGNVMFVTGEIPSRSNLHVGGNETTEEVYGGRGQNYFSGKTFYVMQDMDFGGTGTDYFKDTTLTTLTDTATKAAGLNSYYTYMGGHNYYPVGSQARNDGVYKCLNTTSDYHWWGTFCGCVDGQGHLMDNIYLDRGDASNIGGSKGGSNYYQSGALIGRLGMSDSTDTSLAKNDAIVENIAVDGFIYNERSVGGIIGKTLHVDSNYKVYVKDCINFATIWSTQSKGSGGIVGASWNDAQIYNCVNFGRCINGYTNGCGGITGTTEADFWNCYNVGMVSLYSGNPASYGSQNGGGVVNNCYALVGSTYSGNGKYSNATTPYLSYNLNGVQAIDAIANASSADFLKSINGATRDWVQVSSKNNAIDGSYTFKSEALKTALTTQVLFYSYDGTTKGTQTGVANLPIPRAFVEDTATATGVSYTGKPVLDYSEVQTISMGDLVLTADYSDGTSEQITNYTVKIDGVEVASDYAVKLSDNGKKMTVTCTLGGVDYTKPDAGTDWIINVTPTYPSSISSVTGVSVTPSYESGMSIGVTDDAYANVKLSNNLTVKAYFKTTESHAADANVSLALADKGKEVTSVDDLTKIALDYKLTAADAGKDLYVVYTMNEKSAYVLKCSELVVNEALTRDSEGAICISTTDEWNQLALYQSDSYRTDYTDVAIKLAADLDFSGKEFNCLGNSSTALYVGTFDGQNHTVTLSADTEIKSNYSGLLAYAGGTVKNVKLAGDIVVKHAYSGIVCQAYKDGTVVENCVNYANITNSNTSSKVGGIVGNANATTTIKNCSNYGAVSGGYVGGIAGYNGWKATIVVDNCTNYGNITCIATSSSSSGAGIMGYLYGVTGNTISNCVNYGTVTSANNVTLGGIAGYAKSSTDASIKDCLNLGEISVDASKTDAVAGGIVGWESSPGLVIENCGNAAAVTAGKVGGVVGYSDKACTINNSYNTGSVTTTCKSTSNGGGGIIGTQSSTAGSVINNCYNTGSVVKAEAATSPVGALVGYAGKNMAFNDCAWLETSCADTTGGQGEDVEVTTSANKMTAEAMKAADFVETLNGKVDDGVKVFKADFTGDSAVNGGYPIFTWQDKGLCVISVSSDAADLHVDDTFTVLIAVKGGSIAGAEMTLTYDKSVFELANIEQGEGLTLGAGGSFVGTVATGKISFMGNTAATSGSIVVAKATFKCKAESDGSAINVADLTVTRSGEAAEVEAIAGGALNLPVGGKIFTYTLGDINDNTRINIADAQIALDMANGVYGTDYATLLSQLANGWNTATVKAAADVNLDKKVTADDARAIQHYVHTGSFEEVSG